MEANKHNPMKDKMKKDCIAAESEDDTGGAAEDDRRKRAAGGVKRGSGDGSTKSCQAEKCSADLTDAKTYHRRHKVCEVHAKAQVVVVAGIRQRFCQQCSRFHEVSEFDDAKRSCRRRLAGHNERRRKNPSDNSSSSSSRSASGQVQIAVQEPPNYNHFHVR